MKTIMEGAVLIILSGMGFHNLSDIDCYMSLLIVPLCGHLYNIKLLNLLELTTLKVKVLYCPPLFQAFLCDPNHPISLQFYLSDRDVARRL